MIKGILVLAAATYWVSFLFRMYLWNKDWTSVEKRVSLLEKGALLIFTAGLVLYIGKLRIVDGEVRSLHFDMPVSFLLFAWSIGAANLVTEIMYNNRWSALYANFWIAISLTMSPAGAQVFRGLFTYDLEWLSFHRLCFLLGYAFCVLALPLVVHFCLVEFHLRNKPADLREKIQPRLWSMDRMTYRLVLWALPLLTAGIITEGLLLLEVGKFPSPEAMWAEKQETFLALAAWFLCGIYLHTRLFFGWRNLRAAGLYLAGLVLLLIGHFSYTFPSHS